MEENLLSIDSEFTEHYRSLLRIQEKIKSKLDVYVFDLTKTEISDAIVNRMSAFWYFNVQNNKNILDRNLNTTSADFFTETCLIFFKTYFESKYNVKVYSEKSIVKGKNAIRPDISIWDEDRLVATIELKVSNGWKTKTIMQHLENREKQIQQHFPNAKFGVVAFWNFFNKELEGWNSKYIGLIEWNVRANHPRIDSAVENLMKEIEKGLISK